MHAHTRPFLFLLLLAAACTDLSEPVTPVDLHPRMTLTADIVVTNTNDAGAGSLRAAVAAASDGNVIGFDAALSGGTITLSTTLSIASSVTIEGPETGGMTISGGGAVRVMQIAAAKSVTLRNTTVTGGQAGTGDGGGISNAGTLTLDHSTVSGNQAFSAGAINGGSVVIRNSTVSNNGAKLFPGVFASSVLVEQATVYGNVNLPCPECSSTDPEPINVAISASSSLTLVNSIVESCYSEAFPTFTGINMSTDASWTCMSIAVSDLLLGPLADNGGPTRTRALLTGSPAIDAVTTCSLTSDQRYVTRPQGSACDVGAYEFNTFINVSLVINDKGIVDPANGAVTLTGTISCGATASVDLDLTLTQDLRIKRVPVHVTASGDATLACGSTQPWSMTVVPSNSAFINSDAQATATATGGGGVVPAGAQTVVHLAWKRRK